MGATASLAPNTLSVEPGGMVTCEVKVRNTGSVVDQFTFTVLGDAAGWSSVEPATLSLFPGAEGSATVFFRPPRSADIPSASVPFAVRVASKEDPEGSVVEEGALEVGAFLDASAELVPRTSRGRRSATHDLAVDNRGNARLNAEVDASDPDGQLLFEVEPPSVVADPNTAFFGKVRVRPRKRFLRGPPKTHPFTVVLSPDGAAQLRADGAMLQEALLPKWLPKALLALLALAVIAAILWATLLRPAIQSAARDAVEEPLREQAAQVAAVKRQADATAAQVANLSGGPVATPSPAPTDVGPGPAGPGVPFDSRLPRPAAPGRRAVVFDAGQTREDFFEVPADRTLEVTDLVLQNPNGDSGALSIVRDQALLLEVRLDNFRDLDYHFVVPTVFTAGQRLVLRVRCDTPGQGSACTPAVYFAGLLRG